MRRADIFLGDFYEVNFPPMVGQSGPLIVSTDTLSAHNNSLDPVWFKPVPQKDVASGLTPQIYQGQAGAQLVAGGPHPDR